MPPAATWSRVRHSSVPGQQPLRTRQQPLGASRLAPSQQQKVMQSNSEVEVVLWFLEQALRYDGKQMQVLLVFPEDLGGSATEGPATIWDSVEVRSLSGLSDAQRGSAFMCELTGADQRRPLGIFTNITSLITRTYPGWPSLSLQGNTELIYEGPLPPSCQCLPAHRQFAVSMSTRSSAPPLPSRLASSFGGTRWPLFTEYGTLGP